MLTAKTVHKNDRQLVTLNVRDPVQVRVRAVSYTHLDVYKRQMFDRIADNETFLDNVIFSDE